MKRKAVVPCFISYLLGSVMSLWYEWIGCDEKSLSIRCTRIIANRLNIHIEEARNFAIQEYICNIQFLQSI